MNLLNRIREKVAEVGIFYALQTLKWRLISSRHFDVNLWIVGTREIQDLATVVEQRSAIRWATGKDIPQLIECGVKPDRLRENLAKRLKVAVYEEKGRIVAYGQYVVSSWDQDDWLIFQFNKRDFFGAGSWVAPEFRGQNIAPQIYTFAWSHFARNGYKRTVGITNALNKNFFRASQKVGPATFDRFWYIRLFGFTYFQYGLYKKIGRWNPTNRMEVHLDLVDSSSNAKVASVTRSQLDGVSKENPSVN